MTKISKFEFIECVLQANSTATRYSFNDQPNLRYVALNQLEIFNNATVSYSILSNNINITPAQMLTGYLVLYYSDKESVKYIPLNSLVTNANNATTTGYPSNFGYKTFEGQQVQWSKSYVQFTTSPMTSQATNASVCVGVYYS
jgi:hypothetical protein